MGMIAFLLVLTGKGLPLTVGLLGRILELITNIAGELPDLTRVFEAVMQFLGPK